ncbi:hypothetical protein VPH35_083123 [Triticum aestivum]
MAFGRTLFKGKNCKETFRNVLHREVEFPCDTQRRMPELTDLISWLLQRDPARRLGYAGVGLRWVHRQHSPLVAMHHMILCARRKIFEITTKPNTDKIRVHPFFAGMAWDMLADVTHPPYIPPPAEDNAADGEGFDVRDYFKKLHQSPAPPPPESGSSSSSPSSDFSSVF